jgi:hypothetical protein
MNSRAVMNRGVVILAAVSLALVAGCGGGSSPSVEGTGLGSATTVAVTPADATVFQGATMQFQATVQGQSNQAVTWSISQGGLGTIDSTGLYTAPKDASGGPFRVVATSQAQLSVTGTAEVTVAPIKVTVSPGTVTLAPGGTKTFTANIDGLDDKRVTWSVQETAGGLINNTGFYAAPASMGFFHVVATSVADGTKSGSASITVTTSSASFTPAGDMQNARGLHTATSLQSGKVLLTGGVGFPSDCLVGMVFAELYDPAANSFSKIQNMGAQRYAHTATRLSNGEVLVTGGFGQLQLCDLQKPEVDEVTQASAELYNPSTGAFESTGSMAEARGGHTATLLSNGKVLIAGGGDSGGFTLPYYGTSSRTAELYDPATGEFTPTGSMVTARYGHTSVLLKNGKVLIVGGVESGDSLFQTIPTAELYDPAAGTFTPTGSLAVARAGHTATVLSDGKVLITGGLTDTNDPASSTSTAEIYDPSTRTFSTTGEMGEARAGHTATLLPNGTVLIAGGGLSSPIAFAEIYDPSTGTFAPTGSMETGRVWHSATLLQNGKVLVAGGGYFLSSAELYK